MTKLEREFAMGDRTTWEKWNEANSLVDVAYGLAILADYDCADTLLDEEEKETARHATMHAARLCLRRAAALMNEIEPLESRGGAK